MIQIAICDDEEQIRTDIEQQLYTMEDEIGEPLEIYTFSDGEPLCEALEHQTHFDIILLDIMMPHKDGVYVGKLIREKLQDNITQIIYISAEQNYAMELFQVRPVDFLLKPLDVTKLKETFLTALHLIHDSRQLYTFEKQGEIYRIPIGKILYIESHGRVLILHTQTTEYEYYGKLSDVSELLKKYQFLYIHKSYLVNYAMVQKMRRDSVVLENGIELPISRNRRDEVRQKCYLYM